MYHKISNLYIDSDKHAYAAMFTRTTETSTVENLIMENVDITNRYEKNIGGTYAAGIVGWNMGYISRCGIESGEIQVLRTTALRTYDDVDAGGICAGSNGNINECYNKAKIYAEHDTKKSAQINIGGICGLKSGGTYAARLYIENCYNRGEITCVGGASGYISVGSIAGGTYKNSSIVNNCYSSYNIPIAGARKSGMTIQNCYYTESDVNALKADRSKLGEAFVANEGYPILSWELEARKLK